MLPANSAAHGRRPAAPSQQPTTPGRPPAKRGPNIPLILGVLLMVAALVIVPRLIGGGGQFRDAGDINEQWAALSKDIPADQVVQLDWLQYFDRKDAPGNFWLQAHYVNADQVAQRSLLDDGQDPRPKRVEDAPRQVSADDIAELQNYAAELSCPDEKFAGVALRFLPDGETMLMGGCGEAYNLAGEGYQHVQIDGERYAVRSPDLKENMHATLGLAKHLMPAGIARAEVTTVGYTTIGAAIQQCTPRLRTPMQKPTLTSQFLTCNEGAGSSGAVLNVNQLDPKQAADAAASAAEDSAFKPSPYARMQLLPADSDPWLIVVLDEANGQKISYDMQGKRLG